MPACSWDSRTYQEWAQEGHLANCLCPPEGGLLLISSHVDEEGSHPPSELALLSALLGQCTWRMCRSPSTVPIVPVTLRLLSPSGLLAALGCL